MGNKNFYYAVATLMGTIIGAGIFALPYAIEQAGFLIGLFYLLGLGGLMILIGLFFGEIILRTNEEHALVGYADKYLGSWGKRAVTLTTVAGLYGSLLAYIIVSGEFLKQIFGGSPFVWSLIFFSLGAFFILIGLRMISVGEFFMTGLLLLTVFIIGWQGWPYITTQNFQIINWSKVFFPYGVILFSLGGTTAIPAMRQILKGQEKNFKKAIIIGSAVPVAIYILFAFIVIGVSNGQATPEAIEGLIVVLGKKMLILGAIFGLLAVFTSFLVLGLYLKDVFRYDYYLNKYLSWFLACFIPLFGFLDGLRSFIVILAFTGAILGGLESIILILVYKKAKKKGDREPEYSLKLPRFGLYFIILFFILGIISQF